MECTLKNIVTQAPIVVFNDADIESAVNGVAFASFVASGQTCVSGTRILVQDGVYDEFVAHFLHKVERIRRRMGDRASFFFNRIIWAFVHQFSIRSHESEINYGKRYIPTPSAKN